MTDINNYPNQQEPGGIEFDKDDPKPKNESKNEPKPHSREREPYDEGDSQGGSQKPFPQKSEPKSKPDTLESNPEKKSA